MTVSKVLFSSKDQTWGTPPKLWHELNMKYGPFKLDAATNSLNPLRTPKYYTEQTNGLERKWYNPTYVNPPYGREIYDWVKKANTEAMLGNRVVMLIPARTDTRWFHDFIYNRPLVETIFLKGRLAMWNYHTGKAHPHKAPFPSMIVIFRAWH